MDNITITENLTAGFFTALFAAIIIYWAAYSVVFNFWLAGKAARRALLVRRLATLGGRRGNE